MPHASLDHNDFLFQDIGLGGDIDPANLAWRVFLAWHSMSQRIYVAIARVTRVLTGYPKALLQGEWNGKWAVAVDPEFLEMFTFPLAQGRRDADLNRIACCRGRLFSV